MSSNKKATIIVPPVVVHGLDPHTGIPFMPHMAAYVAGALRDRGGQIQVLDCFGLQPNNPELVDNFMLLGLSIKEAVHLIDKESSICLIYCRTMSEFIAVEQLSQEIARQRPDIDILLFENIQAVTSFSLLNVAEKFFENENIRVIILGEPETRIWGLVYNLLNEEVLAGVSGIVYRKKDGEIVFTGEATFEKDLDKNPWPAWELFPLQGYWIAGFAHAPCTKDKFLPLLTSRGCPFRCKFCLAASVNYQWRSRSAKDVVDEMEFFYKTMGVRDFHISDLNPTVNEKRINDICTTILERRLPVTWKIAQGTKIETIKKEETLDLMKKAGCQFISFSPESGSKRLLRTVDKPFDHEHGLRMARKMAELGINVQCCFLAGLPEETEDDRLQSIDYMKKLVKIGVDEVSCNIFWPVPGSVLSKAIKGYYNYSECNPNPTWREDYDDVKKFKNKFYMIYFLYKCLHPRKVLIEMWSLVTKQYKSKMAMSLFKQGKFVLLRYCPFIFRKLDPVKQLQHIQDKYS